MIQGIGVPMELWLLRHMRARHALADEFDIDRPLSEAGQQDARKLSAWLAQSGRDLPGNILVSPAVRTRQTADEVLRPLTTVEPVRDERIWEAGAEELISILEDHGRPGGRLMLVGHNPGLEWLVGWLTGQRLTLGLQPGGLVIIDMNTPPGPGCGRIETVVQPSDLT